MTEQILQGFREIAADQGYDPEEVYIVGAKIVMPVQLAEKILKAIETMEQNNV